MIFLELLTKALILTGATIHLINKLKNDTDLATNEYRLPDYIIPKHYDIYINATLPLFGKLKNERFFGTCVVYIRINRPTHHISLHAQRPQVEIHHAVLKQENSLIQYIPENNAKYNNQSHIIVFQFTQEIPSGNFSLIMIFTSSLNDNTENFFKFSYDDEKDRRWLYGTHFQAIGARQIFPCWDEPALKATFNISIEHREKNIVLSNMNYVTNTNFTNNTEERLTRFNITPEISTYHVAFLMTRNMSVYNISTYLYYAIDDLVIFIWHRPDVRSQMELFTVDIIPEILTSFKFYWENVRLNIRIMHYVLMPGLQLNGIQKWGIAFNRETDIIYNEEKDSPMHQIEVINTIGRQIAHQWFSILVSPSWWSQHWLIEGIATLVGMNAVDKRFPDFHISDLFIVQMRQESLRLDKYFIMEPLISEINKPSEINSFFSFSYYIKGPVILRMLQHVLTNKIFRNGIEEFYKTQSITVDDFYNDMQTIYNTERKDNMESFSIKHMMDAWTKQEHYPILKVNLKKDINSLMIKIRNVNSLDLKYDWWIPITITTQTELDFTISNRYWIKITKLDTTYQHFIPYESLQEDEWYIINLQQIGYYRVNYDFQNWRKIAKYLKSSKYNNIHVLNRAQIIDDAYYFMTQSQLRFNIFLKLTKYLSQETDYVAWYSMFKAFEDMSRMFPFLDDRFSFIKTNFIKSLNGLLQSIDFDKKPSNESNVLTDCLRQEAAKWACIFGSPNCTKTAEVKLYQHLTNPKQYKLLPWWKEWTFCNGLKTFNSSIWEKIMIIHSTNPDDERLKYMACSQNSTILIQSIKTLTVESIVFKNNTYKNNYVNTLHFIISKHAENDEFLDYILQNLHLIVPRKIAITVVINIINHIYSKENLNKLVTKMTLFANHSHKELTSTNYWRNVFDQSVEFSEIILSIHYKIERRKSEIESQSNYYEKIISTMKFNV